MKFTLACLLLSSNFAFAAGRVTHLKDETAKIEVGPDSTSLVGAEIDPSVVDPTDAVDKPLVKPVVSVTEAPHGPASVEASNDVDAPAEEPATSTHEPASVSVTKAKPAAVVAAKPKASATPTPTPKPTPEETDDEEEADDSAPIVKPFVEAGPAPTVKPTAQAKPDAEPATAAESNDEEAAAKPAAEIPKAQPVPATHAVGAPVREEKASKPVIEGVTAEQSMKWLENGNTRFVTKKFRADGKTEGDRARIAKDQKPHAIVLSCSDSRVPPELIFDQALGEITTIRVAGEVPDASVIASIEQTILKQHPHLLVVLGHTQCESVETALGWKDTASAGSESLDRMVAEIKPHLKTVAQSSRSPGLATEAALQADGVARDLSEHSEIIKKAVDSGELTIKSGLYWLDTGKVKFY